MKEYESIIDAMKNGFNIIISHYLGCDNQIIMCYYDGKFHVSQKIGGESEMLISTKNFKKAINKLING